MNAKSLASTFSARFFENGNYEALGSKLSGQNLDAIPGATGDGLEEFFEKDEGFAGLAVQSVGYTHGAEEEAVVIYVTRGSKRALKALPDKVDDVAVETRVMGRLKAGPAASGGQGFFHQHNGRIACGSSCAPSRENYAGTLGCLAKTRDGRMVLVSNNHILAACNHTPVGMPILAPATMDARPRRPAPAAAGLFDSMIELRSGVPSLVEPMRLDAATALVEDPERVSSWQGDAAHGYDTPHDIVAPQAGLRVKKWGRTTGLTAGTVEAFVPTPWVLPYKSVRFAAEVWFQDTWTVCADDDDPFALPGDSGSLILTEDGNAAVGLLFAVNTSGGYAIFTSLDRVLRDLDELTIVSRHGV